MTAYATCACGAELHTERAAIEHAKTCRGQGLPRGWTLDDYNRAVTRSRQAYNSDQRREESRKPAGSGVRGADRKPRARRT